MTVPARGWLVLRRAAGKRLSHPFVERKWDGLGVQTSTLSAAWSFGLYRGQGFARMTTLEAVNGKSRSRRVSFVYWTVVRLGTDHLENLVSTLCAGSRTRSDTGH